MNSKTKGTCGVALLLIIIGGLIVNHFFGSRGDKLTFSRTSEQLTLLGDKAGMMTPEDSSDAFISDEDEPAVDHVCVLGCNHTVSVAPDDELAKSSIPALAVNAGLVDDILSGPRDEIQFDLPGGVKAVGTLEQVRSDEAGIYLVQGRLREPQPGTFIFSKERLKGKAGPVSGHIVFDSGELAYKVEPFGADFEKARLVQREKGDIVCVDYIADTNEPSMMPGDHLDVEDNVGVNDGVPILESYRGALAVIYLDLDGEYIDDPSWGSPFQALPFGFSDAQMRSIWERISEDFAPFNINITTDIRVYNAAPTNSRMRCVFTPTKTSNSGGAAGIAWNNTFDSSFSETCFVYRSNVKHAAMIASHELGHTLGLNHHGKNNAEYYGGHGGTGETSWTPLMGNGLSRNLSQWSKGEYNGASNPLQDDLFSIANYNTNVSYRPDDHGATYATMSYLEILQDDTVRSIGIIERTEDVDAFRFSLIAAGTLSLEILPYVTGPNLDIQASIYDESGTLLYTANPETNLTASFVGINLVAGNYYISVTGVGFGTVNTGYSDYASLGHYEITGTVSNSTPVDRLTVIEHSPFGTVVGTIAPRSDHGGSSLTFGIQTESVVDAFSIDPVSGELTVDDSSKLQILNLSTNYDILPEIVLFVSIANPANPSLDELLRVVVTVMDIPDAPVIVNPNFSVSEHLEVGSIVGIVDISDPDYIGGIITSIGIAGDPTDTFSIDIDGTMRLLKGLSFTSQASYSLEVTATDNATPALSGTDTVDITVLNAPPQVGNQGLRLQSGNPPIAITLTSLTPDSVTYAVDTPPAFGSLSGMPPNLIYTPGVNFVDQDSFTYVANDGVFDSLPGTVSISAGKLSVRRLGGRTSGYHLTNDEPERFSESSLLKTLDGDDDDVYGTAGYLIFGALPNANGTAFPFTRNFNNFPGWVTAFADGTDFVNVHQSNVFSWYSGPILAGLSGSAVAVSSGGAAGDWAELLTFSIDPSAPKNFRVGIIAGNENAADGSLDPGGLRLSFDGEAGVEMVDLEILNSLTMGMAMFDVSIAGSVSGTFSLEGRNRASSGTSIAGITIDEILHPVAYSQTLFVEFEQTKAFTLEATTGVTSYTIVSQPENGTLVGEAPNLTYEPAIGFGGIDSLTFFVSKDGEDSEIVTVEFEVEPITIELASSNPGYHITGAEASAYRSTDVAKSYDVNDSFGDDAYGTEGYYFYGNGTDNTSNADGKPSWVTAVDYAGVPLVASAAYSDFDNPTLPITTNATDWTTTTIGVVNTSGTTGGLWAELLAFTVNENAPPKFRIGVMAGNEGNTDGRWDPAALRLSLNGGPAIEASGLEVTDLGMVFFDVTIEDNATGTFLIEGQNRSLNGNTRGPSIAGITFDMYNAAPTAYDQRFDLPVDQTAPVLLVASADATSFHLSSLPTYGTLTGIAPNLTYTPPPGFIGSDIFTFYVNDGVNDSEIATVNIEVGAVIVRRSGAETGYHVGEAEAKAFRSMDVTKTFDPDGDDAYGTDGLVIFGDGLWRQYSIADYSFKRKVESLPMWLSDVEPGADTEYIRTYSLYTLFDNPEASLGPSVTDWLSSGVSYASGIPVGDWAELLRIRLTSGAPERFRIGVLAGNGDNDSFDPTGIRISFNGGDPVAVTDLPITNLGMVFFDVSVGLQVGGVFSIEAQNRVGNSVTTIAGLTVDSYDTPLGSYGNWLLTYPNLPGTLPESVALAESDEDRDGMATLLEYVLGGDPTEAESLILPELDVTGENFVFTFTRLAPSASDTTQVFQYSSTLGSNDWTDLYITDPKAAEVIVSTEVNGLQTVTVTLSKSLAVGDRLFGRLKVLYEE